jgi:succinate-semialdehyde dehydrogenase/glutarate-semialdehyde dehydrogenase
MCAGACVLLQVYDAFAELVSAKVSALRVGDGMAPDTTHGPLITPAGVEKVGAATCDTHYCQPG